MLRTILLVFLVVTIATSILAVDPSYKVKFSGDITRRNPNFIHYVDDIRVTCWTTFEMETYMELWGDWELINVSMVPVEEVVIVNGEGCYDHEVFGEQLIEPRHWDDFYDAYIKKEVVGRGSISRTEIYLFNENWIVEGSMVRSVYDPIDNIPWMEDEAWKVHHKEDLSGSCVTLSEHGLSNMIEHALPYYYESEEGVFDIKYGETKYLNWSKISRSWFLFEVEEIVPRLEVDELVIDVYFSEFDAYFHWNADIKWYYGGFDVSGDAYFDKDPCKITFKPTYTANLEGDNLYLNVESISTNIDVDSFDISMNNFFDFAAQWFAEKSCENVKDGALEDLAEEISYIVGLQLQDEIIEGINFSAQPANFLFDKDKMAAYYLLSVNSSHPDPELEQFPPYEGEKSVYGSNNDIDLHLEDVDVNKALRALTEEGRLSFETGELDPVLPGFYLKFQLTTAPSAFFNAPGKEHDCVLGTDFSFGICLLGETESVVEVAGTLFTDLAFNVFESDEGYCVVVDLIDEVYLDAVFIIGKNELELNEETVSNILNDIVVPTLNDYISGEPILCHIECQNSYLEQPIRIDLRNVWPQQGWVTFQFAVERPPVSPMKYGNHPYKARGYRYGPRN